MFLLWLIWTSVGLAAECAPLYESEARELIDASYGTLEGEEPDLPEHDRLMRQVENRMPCADFEVGATLWSRYLVSMAVREYYAGGDWQKPLTTAKRIHPDVELPVRKGHPLREWEPAPEPSDRGPLPDGVTLRLDGHELPAYRPLDALHLLQRWNGDDLQTAVVEGPADIPQAFLVPPKLPAAVRRVKRRKAIHTWGTVGSGALLATGATLWGIALVDNSEFRSEPAAKQDIQGDLKRTGQPLGYVGGVLFWTGAAGLSATWTIQW